MSQEMKKARRQGLIKLAVCFGIKAVVVLLSMFAPSPLRWAIEAVWPFLIKPLFLLLTLGMVWGLVELISGERVPALARRLGW